MAKLGQDIVRFNSTYLSAFVGLAATVFQNPKFAKPCSLAASLLTSHQGKPMLIFLFFNQSKGNFVVNILLTGIEMPGQVSWPHPFGFYDFYFHSCNITIYLPYKQNKYCNIVAKINIRKGLFTK